MASCPAMAEGLMSVHAGIRRVPLTSRQWTATRFNAGEAIASVNSMRPMPVPAVDRRRQSAFRLAGSSRIGNRS